MYPSLIDEYPIHFQVCLYAIGFILKFDECVLQAVTRLPVSYYFAAFDIAEP